MNKKTGKIGIILLLSLCLMPFSSMQAGANSLTQLDIRKANAASSYVDVTLYTTTPYGDDIAVTKKSDNKYVILMPNVSSSAGSKPDLSGIKDLISDIDVKSVNDESGGYTKVTLITTKPVNIRTQAQNSVPLTAEQRAYKNLIAQSRTHTNTPAHVPDSRKLEPKTTVTVNKTAQPVKMIPAKQDVEPLKKDNIVEIAQQKLKETAAAAKDNVKKSEVQPENQNVKTPKVETVAENVISKHVPENINVPKADAKSPIHSTGLLTSLKQVKAHIGRTLPNMPITLVMILLPILGLMFLVKLIKNSMKNSHFLRQSFREHLADQPVISTDYEDIVSNADLNWQAKYQKFLSESGSDEKTEMQLAARKYAFIKSQNTVLKHDLSEDIVRIQPRAAINSAPPREVENKPVKQHIVMSDAVEELEKQIDKLETEKEIKSVKMSEEVSLKEEKKVSDMENENEKYLVSLEKLLHDSPDVEKANFDEESLLQSLEENFKEVNVHSEDNMISSRMSEVPKMTLSAGSKKLKAFANKVALEESQRKKPLPKSREEIKRSSRGESKHVNLGSSNLHSNPRMLEGGNLRVADLIAKSSKFRQNSAPKVEIPKAIAQKPKPVFGKEKGYAMASLDEFFALPEDGNRATASPSLSSKVAESLAQVKPSMKMQKAVPAKNNVTNPIAQTKSDTKENYINGLIVKSGFNIDKNKGFYIVNLDGEQALVGRINEEIFVLKKFSSKIEKPLQVRQDNANVYMVKADGFRSLVEVNEDKMGVLIEL